MDKKFTPKTLRELKTYDTFEIQQNFFSDFSASLVTFRSCSVILYTTIAFSIGNFGMVL